jgi:HEAT repeat protein
MRTTRSKFLLALCLSLLFSSTSILAQSTDRDDQKIAARDEEPDAPVAPSSAKLKTDPVAAHAAAISILQVSAASTRPEIRIAAIGALGTLGRSPEAKKLIEQAFADKDQDVRVAALTASAATKDPALIPGMKKLLDDPVPEVAFAAAVALWKMKDHSGIGILYGVLGGDRKSGSSFVKSGMHQADKDLHSPSTLAKIGAEQGAYALLGPFGIGLDAMRMAHKNGSNGNSARILTVNLLSEDHSEVTLRQLVDALQDNDAFVRSAAAKALAEYRGSIVTDGLIDTFDDKKPSVRCAAAASYLKVTSAAHAHTAKTTAAGM